MVNISEGRDVAWLADLAASLRGVADLHVDADHHRSVLTLLDEASALIETVIELARRCIEHLDLAAHRGVHPRIGVIDVIPFVPLGAATLADAVIVRDLAAHRLAEELSLPVFLYGPLTGGSARSLPEIRREAFVDLAPDLGPLQPHPTAGGAAVGARPPLVAWNLWLEGMTLERARAVAATLRSASVRALGLEVSGAVQVSCNLIDPMATSPAEVADAVRTQLEDDEQIIRAELVGLLPRAALDRVDPDRWRELDLSEARTIEAAARRLEVVVV